jgi:hypothetical protein
VFRNSVGVDGVDLDEVLGSGVEASNVEHRLVGRYVDHHGARVGLVNLQGKDNIADGIYLNCLQSKEVGKDC